MANSRLDPWLQGGVAGSILGPDFTAAVSASMNAGMDAENHRRQLASQTPGLGAEMPLPPNPNGLSTGKASLDVPVVGEGYDVQAAISDAQISSYGPSRPVYADGLVGGVGFQGGFSEPAVEGFRFAVSPGLSVPVLAAAPAKPGLVARLRGFLRRR
jgi:hypothetical protein